MDSPFDLIAKYEGTSVERDFQKFKENVRGFSNTNESFGAKTGDKIQFVGGYNDDITFLSKILGFNANGCAFVLWDCYWFAIDLTDKKRKVKLIA